jgi:hypothetical protein
MFGEGAARIELRLPAYTDYISDTVIITEHISFYKVSIKVNKTLQGLHRRATEIADCNNTALVTDSVLMEI